MYIPALFQNPSENLFLCLYSESLNIPSCKYTLWNSASCSPAPTGACVTGCPVGILCGTAKLFPGTVRGMSCGILWSIQSLYYCTRQTPGLQPGSGIFFILQRIPHWVWTAHFKRRYGLHAHISLKITEKYQIVFSDFSIVSCSNTAPIIINPLIISCG